MLTLQSFFLLCFVLTFILNLVTMLNYFKKLKITTGALGEELDDLRDILGRHNPGNLPTRVFTVVVDIHNRSVGHKNKLHRITKLAILFLTLTTLWLQTPSILSLTSDIQMVPKQWTMAYAIFQAGVPILAFNWMIWKFVESSQTIVKLKSMISRCQLTDKPT